MSGVVPVIRPRPPVAAPPVAAMILPLCLTIGLAACGVSADVYTRTLHERDQLRDRVGQAGTEAAAQRRQLGELQAALTEQQQVNHALQARVAELEAQTADQTLAQEALAGQLRSVVTEREELLLKLDESKAPSPSSALSGAGGTAGAGGAGVAGGTPLPGENQRDQRLTAELRDVIATGHLTVRHLASGVMLRLDESFLFAPDSAVLTAEGRRMLSTVTTALFAARARRLQIRLGVQRTDNPAPSEQAERGDGAQLTVFNRGMALVRQLDGGEQTAPELVVVVDRKGGASTQVESPGQTVPLGEIQIMVEWPSGP